MRVWDDSYGLIRATGIQGYIEWFRSGMERRMDAGNLFGGLDTDVDGDGYTMRQGDCNDNDASLNLGWLMYVTGRTMIAILVLRMETWRAGTGCM